jgi:hypothetical protein
VSRFPKNPESILAKKPEFVSRFGRLGNGRPPESKKPAREREPAWSIGVRVLRPGGRSTKRSSGGVPSHPNVQAGFIHLEEPALARAADSAILERWAVRLLGGIDRDYGDGGEAVGAAGASVST